MLAGKNPNRHHHATAKRKTIVQWQLPNKECNK